MNPGSRPQSARSLRISSLVCHEEPVIDLQRKRGVSAALVLPTFDKTATKITPSASRYLWHSVISSLGLNAHLSIGLLIRMHAADHLSQRGRLPAGMFPKP